MLELGKNILIDLVMGLYSYLVNQNKLNCQVAVTIEKSKTAIMKNISVNSFPFKNPIVKLQLLIYFVVRLPRTANYLSA